MLVDHRGPERRRRTRQPPTRPGRAGPRYALLVSGRRGSQFIGVVMPGEGIEDGRLIMVQIPCIQMATEHWVRTASSRASSRRKTLVGTVVRRRQPRPPLQVYTAAPASPGPIRPGGPSTAVHQPGRRPLTCRHTGYNRPGLHRHAGSGIGRPGRGRCDSATVVGYARAPQCGAEPDSASGPQTELSTGLPPPLLDCWHQASKGH